jgi:hypothetical protein
MSSCRLSFVPNSIQSIYTLPNGVKEFIILTLRSGVKSRPYSNMPPIWGELFCNQDFLDAERKLDNKKRRKKTFSFLARNFLDF